MSTNCIIIFVNNIREWLEALWTLSTKKKKCNILIGLLLFIVYSLEKATIYHNGYDDRLYVTRNFFNAKSLVDFFLVQQKILMLKNVLRDNFIFIVMKKS